MCGQACRGRSITADPEATTRRTLARRRLPTAIGVVALPGILLQRLRIPPIWAGLAVGAVGVASLPSVIALAEFRLAEGTPWPFDSTNRPIRAGPYRYLRSPMQLSGVLLLVIMAVLTRQAVVAAAALITLSYNRLFSTYEYTSLEERFGQSWTMLADPQRRWTPSWRPSPNGEQARVWIDLSCDQCRPVADLLLAFHPVGLTISDAAAHPDTLVRIRYERDDGVCFDGVRAAGASLEHLHFGWAMLGWLLRTPVVWRFWQLIGDASGLGPRPSRSDSPPDRLPLGKQVDR